MREIEFRGKHIDTGEFHYGCLLEGEDTIFIRDKVRHEKHGYLTHPVIPETLGQYGNRKTEKGRKIYEGDVCFQEVETEIGDERIYCVFTFIDEWNMFAWLNIDEYNGYKEDGVEYLSQDDWYSSDTKYLHYAGNIYDNPELLNE